MADKKFVDETAAASWSATDVIPGSTAGGADRVWQLQTILGTSSNRIPTKVHLGTNGLNSSGPIVVNPNNVSLLSSADDFGVAGTGNHGGSIYHDGTGRLSFGDPTNGVDAASISHAKNGNSLTIQRGNGRIQLTNTGFKIYDGTEYGSDINKFVKSQSWTPTVIGSVVSGSATYGTQLGRYSIFADEIHFFAEIVLTAKTGVDGNILIDGLPETAATGLTYGSIYIGPVQKCAYGIDMRAEILAGADQIRLRRNVNDVSGDDQPISDSDIGSTFALTLWGSYRI